MPVFANMQEVSVHHDICDVGEFTIDTHCLHENCTVEKEIVMMLTSIQAWETGFPRFFAALSLLLDSGTLLVTYTFYCSLVHFRFSAFVF